MKPHYKVEAEIEKRAAAEINEIMAQVKVGTGSIPCPRCGGTIKYSSDGRRALRVFCETPNCVKIIG